MPETVGDVVPLEVHISNINLGIERLEQQREAGRKLEAERLASLTNKVEQTARAMRIGDREL